MDRDLEIGTESTEVLIHGIVDNFPHKMVEPRAIVNVSNVHARALANSIEALEHSDVVAAVARGRRRRNRRGDLGFSHDLCTSERDFRMANMGAVTSPKAYPKTPCVPIKSGAL